MPETPQLLYGGDYNPEQWPESTWTEDARLMQQAGVNFVSIAIFSWSRIQPHEDTFDFGWLDRIMDLMHAHDIRVCLATATASPPPWLSLKYPDVLPVTDTGVVLSPGSRQHYSPSSPAYRHAAARLVRELALRYRSHPALAAWHINNEYACHMPECHSDVSTLAFREWLKNRYGSIQNLNDAWHTTFWSQIYSEWEQIFTPRKAPYFPNPCQCLDFKRFTSDTFLACLLIEKEILREITPGIPITTNFMGFFKPLDYHRWAQELDFTSWDSYPDPTDEKAGRLAAAAGHDLTRSLKPGKPFILLEQATSAVNWRPLNMPKRPGLMRLWSLQALARGADGVLFFQWRASRGGAEKFHSSLIQHAGVQNNRVWNESEALGKELKLLSPIAGTTIRARAAIAFDWHSWWALELPSKPAEIQCIEKVLRFHHWFCQNNIPVDFVHPSGDLRNYDLIIAPALYLIDHNSTQNLIQFVASGGTLLTTYFTAIVDQNDQVHSGPYPGSLRDLMGFSIEEFHPYPPQRTNLLIFPDCEHSCSNWCDILQPATATVLATYGSDYFKGSPAFTQNVYESGNAFHLGTDPDNPALDKIMQLICTQAGIQPILRVPPEVEVTLRESTTGDKRFLFLLNHSSQNQTVPLGNYTGTDLITKASIRHQLQLAPMEVSIIALGNP